MNDTANSDKIGIRNTPTNLIFTNGANIQMVWHGRFEQANRRFWYSERALVWKVWPPYFADQINIGISSRAIPELGNHALIVGIIALAFVVFKSACEKEKEKIEIWETKMTIKKNRESLSFQSLQSRETCFTALFRFAELSLSFLQFAKNGTKVGLRYLNRLARIFPLLFWPLVWCL